MEREGSEVKQVNDSGDQDKKGNFLDHCFSLVSKTVSAYFVMQIVLGIISVTIVLPIVVSMFSRAFQSFGIHHRMGSFFSGLFITIIIIGVLYLVIENNVLHGHSAIHPKSPSSTPF